MAVFIIAPQRSSPYTPRFRGEKGIEECTGYSGGGYLMGRERERRSEWEASLWHERERRATIRRRWQWCRRGGEEAASGGGISRVRVGGEFGRCDEGRGRGSGVGEGSKVEGEWEESRSGRRVAPRVR
ncbi:hypothetical protein Tco_1170061 [Tanacetum coccineum]